MKLRAIEHNCAMSNLNKRRFGQLLWDDDDDLKKRHRLFEQLLNDVDEPATFDQLLHHIKMHPDSPTHPSRIDNDTLLRKLLDIIAASPYKHAVRMKNYTSVVSSSVMLCHAL